METSAAPSPPSRLARLDAGLARGCAWLAMAGMCALVAAIAVVVGDIVWRRIGGGSFIGSVDLTQLSVMIAVSWAIPHAFATGAHVSVDLLSASFGLRLKRALDVAASLAGAAICGLLGWLSCRRALEVWGYGDVSQDLAIPMIWFWAALLTGLAVSVAVCLVRALRLTVER